VNPGTCARAELREATNTERFEMRKAVERMVAVEHHLERELDAFSVRLADSEHGIEAALRVEHSGHDPQRPLSWRSHESIRTEEHS
jgi:hypothetical protein